MIIVLRMAPAIAHIIPLSIRIIQAKKGTVSYFGICFFAYYILNQGRFRLFVIMKAKMDAVEPEIFTICGALYPRGLKVRFDLTEAF